MDILMPMNSASFPKRFIHTVDWTRTMLILNHEFSSPSPFSAEALPWLHTFTRPNFEDFLFLKRFHIKYVKLESFLHIF